MWCRAVRGAAHPAVYGQAGSGRKRHPDRLEFQGVLFVLHTGIKRCT